MNDQHAPLREDVRLLGDLLGLTIKEQAGEQVFSNIEQIRSLSKAAIAGDKEAAEQLSSMLRDLPIEQLQPITKAFSQFLNFANIAEQYHRIRRGRWYKMDRAQGPQPGSLEQVIHKLRERNISTESLFDAICAVNIQFVLTSHPTEVKRRSILRKYNRIANALKKLDTSLLIPEEVDEIKTEIHQEMTVIWQTPELRSQKPTPVDEAKWAFAIIESSIWHAIPLFMRELDRTVKQELKKELPLDCGPIRIDSWLGGDRDGNPNVTPEVTRQVVFMARWVLADLLLNEIRILRDSLSIDILAQVKQTLKATKYWARDNFLQHTEAKEPVYHTSAEILAPLYDCYNWLVANNAKIVAQGHLLDIIRQVQCFGAELVRMDIRQESSQHATIMNEITTRAGLGEYSSWSEEQRQQFLLKYLDEPQSLAGYYQDPLFNTIAQLPRDSLGSYVISMSSQPSDVLAVVLLQLIHNVNELLPVVPLFETKNDLFHAAAILEKLLSCSAYKKLIRGYQQIMIGYSDSAKDVGLLAASWAQYCAQEELIKIGQKHAVKIVFFHGRGGSLGRGGWPTHEAILSQPPGSVNGIMRVTQQGEVIQNRFGLREIALRTFSVYTTSTLEAMLSPPKLPKPEWRKLISKLAEVSAEKYKAVVTDDEQFLAYFQTATPTQELKKLAIGSRPDSRNNTLSLKSLRAIPWIFAWTQNRLLLPSWAGVGEALQYAYDNNLGEELANMIASWPFFHTILSMCEMVLAKADIDVAAYYESRLVPPDLTTFGQHLRAQFVQTTKIILHALAQSKLLTNNQVLDRSIQLRKPYLLPLHLLQVELLYRSRNTKVGVEPEVIQALLVSIAGIAAGMRNTG